MDIKSFQIWVSMCMSQNDLGRHISCAPPREEGHLKRPKISFGVYYRVERVLQAREDVKAGPVRYRVGRFLKDTEEIKIDELFHQHPDDAPDNWFC